MVNIFKAYKQLKIENEYLKEKLEELEEKIDNKNTTIIDLRFERKYFVDEYNEYFEKYYKLEDEFDKKLNETINKLQDLLEIKNKLKKDLLNFKTEDNNIKMYYNLFKQYNYTCDLIEHEIEHEKEKK